MKTKFKVGDLVKMDNRNATWMQIIALPDDVHKKYTTMSEHGYISYYSESALMTREEWLVWWERFRDEIIPREWRECAENARRDFVPDPKWDEWVRRASEPLAKPVLTACVDCGETAPETGLTCDGCREDAQGD